MKPNCEVHVKSFVLSIIAVLMLQIYPVFAVAGEPLELVRTILLQGVSGRIDHFGADPEHQRLFVAALGNNTLEVIDLSAADRVRSIQGFGAPQGILHVAQFNRMYVTSGTANRIDVLDGTSYAVIRRIEGLEDADNVRYDSRNQHVYVSYGSGALSILDARTGDNIGRIALAGQPESFQMEQAGGRIFVNVPSAQHIAIVDRARGSVVNTWKLDGVMANFAMALDEKGRRLFIGAREPAKMLVYDTDSGRLVTTLPIGGDVDDIFYDATRKRLYAICGEGLISVVQQRDPEHYDLLGTVRTAQGARTGLFAPDKGELYVAAPARGNSSAHVRVYVAH